MTTPPIEMHSPEINKLLEALSKAQSIMQGAVEDSQNPFFKSKYADLTSVWEACRDPLTKNGLSVVQTIQVIEGGNCLVTILGHLSGQWIKSILPIHPAKNDIQSLGSAITYCRRYALSALVGVCPVDDDGEIAMDRTKKEMFMEEAPAAFTADIPADITKAQVETYITESAKTSGKTRNHIVKGGNQYPDRFFAGLRKWMETNATDL